MFSNIHVDRQIYRHMTHMLKNPSSAHACMDEQMKTASPVLVLCTCGNTMRRKLYMYKVCRSECRVLRDVHISFDVHAL